MRKSAILFTVFFLAGFLLTATHCEAKATKDQMIMVAEETLQKGGVDLEGVNVIYDDGNTYWNERVAYLVKDTSQNHGILPHGVLKTKEYQVVYFDFMESSPLGDTWVFMDPATGDVIGVYEEK